MKRGSNLFFSQIWSKRKSVGANYVVNVTLLMKLKPYYQTCL